MLTRATAKAPEQDDLFSEEVTLLFPALLELEGRLLGSAVRQQAVPSALTPCRLIPFTVRRVTGFEANLKSGETLKIISLMLRRNRTGRQSLLSAGRCCHRPSQA
jgi:hypothetical protein